MAPAKDLEINGEPAENFPLGNRCLAHRQRIRLGVGGFGRAAGGGSAVWDTAPVMNLMTIEAEGINLVIAGAYSVTGTPIDDSIRDRRAIYDGTSGIEVKQDVARSSIDAVHET